MRAIYRLVLAALWGVLCFFLGGYLIQLGITRHDNYEYYGLYVVLSWVVGVIGMLVIGNFRWR